MDTDRHPIPEHFFRELNIEFLIHELKDPLAVAEAGVRSLLQKQDRFGTLTPRQEQILQRILRSTLKSRSMVNTLLEIGRSEAEQFVVNAFSAGKAIYECLLEILEMMNSELFMQVTQQETEQQALALLAHAGIVVHLTPDADDIVLHQDHTKFMQIVGNLFKNALRFRRERVDVRLEQDGDHLLVDIRDDGPGIKPENQALIFQRYAQLDAEGVLARKGHGLGLAGALILARRMGGDLTVQSEAGQGATFRLTLPLKTAIETASNGG
jgi:signal transduction histidine kinase